MTDTVVRTRRGWYHGWTIVAACVLSQAVANGLPVNAFSLFLQDWSTQLHAPISFFQLGLAALGVVSAFGSPWVGVLADKYPARWLLGAVFIYTGFEKALDPVSFLKLVRQYDLVQTPFRPIFFCMYPFRNSSICRQSLQQHGSRL